MESWCSCLSWWYWRNIGVRSSRQHPGSERRWVERGGKSTTALTASKRVFYKGRTQSRRRRAALAETDRESGNVAEDAEEELSGSGPAPDEDEDDLPLPPELPLSDQDRVLLVLSYLGILALVPFLTAKKEFVQWHARQGLLLFGVSLTTLFAMILANVVLWHFHWVLGLIFLLLLLTSIFGVLALMVACILKAFEGERWRIPFLGDFVEKI